MAELGDAGECSVQRQEAVRKRGNVQAQLGGPCPSPSTGLDSEPPCWVSATWQHGNMASFRPQIRQTVEHQNSSFPFSKPFFHATCKIQFTLRKMN